MDLKLLTIVIVLLPLLGYLKLGIWGKRFFKGQSAGFLATSLIFIMMLASVYTAYRYFFVEGKVGDIYQAIIPFKITWLEFSQGFSIDLGIVIDPISVMMLVVVSLVSLMVHLYSMGYMKGEARYATYFAHLCLFTFSMMGLVLSTNLFQIYMFWELVGVSSFLLIGFYFQKPSAVAASKKAFIVTRFADLGFLIGILCLSFYSKTFDIGTMVHTLTQPEGAAYKAIVAGSFLGISALSWGLVLVFMGGAGKSAMFPLHIWLPDAMEGPTPVSALIHAATMVVAGVYLVARLFPLFSLSEPVLHLVTYVGAFSAFFAALIACTQTDIKRVLAYSTMSQIGYMMLSLGVAGVGEEASLGYTASLFHLFTHAMFKALLFLGAGSVIHYVHSNEMKDMGGLRKHMPVTHITFLIACLAIAGVPFLAGFFSKEEILLAAYHKDKLVYNVALITSGITAFYMFRLYFNIFWSRSGEHIHSEGHHGEGPWTMLLPLVVLSLGAIFAGYIPFGEFVSVDGKPLHSHTDLSFSIIPVTLGIGGILIAMALYKKENDRPARLAASLGVFYRWANRKFYIDELYLFVTKKILFRVIATSAAWVDLHVINGFVNKTGDTAVWISEKIKGLQSGKVQAYGMYFLGGIVLLLVYFIYFYAFIILEIRNMNLLILLAIPLLTALGVLFSTNAKGVRIVSLLGSFVQMVAVLLMYATFMNARSSMTPSTMLFEQQWKLFPSSAISFHIGIDGISVAMMILTSLVVLAGVLVSWKVDKMTKEFFLLLQLLALGAYGFFMSLDIMVLFFFLEIAVIPKYLLIAIWGSGKKEYAANKLALMLMLGSALVLIGMLGLYYGTGGQNKTFDLLQLASIKFSAKTQTIFFPFLFIGFGVFTALFPFHTWVPDGHSSAPTAGSMFLAGISMKLGGYGLLRVATFLMPEGAREYANIVIVLSAIAILYGAFATMMQKDLKYINAYSSISHCGFVLLGIGMLTKTAITGAVLQMFSHGLMTALFFAVIGMVYERTHTRLVGEMGGLLQRMPFVITVMFIAGLCSLGLPGFSGFVAEMTVFVGSWEQTSTLHRVATIAGAMSIVVTAVYILRAIGKVAMGPLSENAVSISDGTWNEKVAAIVLIVGIVAMGIYPSWLNELVKPATEIIMAQLNRI